MKNDIMNNSNFVLSAVKGNFGDEISSFYELGVFLDVSYDVRIKHVEKRMLENFGNRVKDGGDMYESETKFLEFVKSRRVEDVTGWSENLDCPVIRIDGTKAIIKNVKLIVNTYQEVKGFLLQL